MRICYANYTPKEEVVEYFWKTVGFFGMLDSCVFLTIVGDRVECDEDARQCADPSCSGCVEGRGGGWCSVWADELRQFYCYFHVAGSA